VFQRTDDSFAHYGASIVQAGSRSRSPRAEARTGGPHSCTQVDGGSFDVGGDMDGLAIRMDLQLVDLTRSV
jgi:hypothetical protein